MLTVFKKIKHEEYEILDQRIFSEADLSALAGLINRGSAGSEIIQNLINKIPKFGHNFDWNVGSILQHTDGQYTVNVLRAQTDIKLFDSIGLAWVLGEFKNTDRIITDFLYNIVKNTKNPDAWWRAAFSLEKLGLEEAVNLLKMSLKMEATHDLDYYLDTIDNKRSLIGVLILSNVENIESIIYPRIKKTFLKTRNDLVIINCCWLIGRLKLIDSDVYKKLLSLISHHNYELKYYTFFALQNNATESLRRTMEKALSDRDPLIRKMAVRGLMNIGNEQSLALLGESLYKETEDAVVGEISTAIYHLKNPIDRTRLLLGMQSYRNENGMISDESDKWYRDPAIYRTFSEAEDPENVRFSLIQARIRDIVIKNPIDLASGTGRMAWQIIDKIPFEGTLFTVDASKQMCDFLSKAIKRERKFTNNIRIISDTISGAPRRIGRNSNFIISSFGFPSRFSDKKLCIKELRAVHKMLSKGGLFFTIGWDETFNDELNRMWYRFIPDRIVAQNFEEWRYKRSAEISSPRNCGLTWFKRGVAVPLQFGSLKEAAFVMGHLFGRDAAQYVVNSGKIEWGMSLGITCNTKEELGAIIKSYERD
jgi:HEAT repeat protein